MIMDQEVNLQSTALQISEAIIFCCLLPLCHFALSHYSCSTMLWDESDSPGLGTNTPTNSEVDVPNQLLILIGYLCMNGM